MSGAGACGCCSLVLAAVQPATTDTYCCSQGGSSATQSYVLSVRYSLNKDVGPLQGFHILTWDGETVLTSTDATCERAATK